jgi:lipid-A-disaccharide synthase
VQYLLTPTLGAAKLLGEPYQFVLAVASTLDVEQLKRQVGQQPIHIVQGDTYNIVHAADLVLVASGTATLETALLERPMVIMYRMAPISYALARLFVRVPFIGMPNLIAERQVVPELIQSAVTPERIVQAARQLLDDPQAYRVTQEGLREVRRRLGSGGAAARAANLALAMLAKKVMRNE